MKLAFAIGCKKMRRHFCNFHKKIWDNEAKSSTLYQGGSTLYQGGSQSFAESTKNVVGGGKLQTTTRAVKAFENTQMRTKPEQ